MVGIKDNLKSLVNRLKEIKSIQSVCTTEFCQGKTTRWGLAWTFNCDMILVELQNPDIQLVFPNFPPHVNLETYISDIFTKDLKCEYERQKCSIYNVIAHVNRWSHQRRKRRQEMKQMKDGKIQKLENNEMEIKVECLENNNKSVLLNFYIQVELKSEDAVAVLSFWVKSGTLGKDGVNQIAQYLKNRYLTLE